MPNTLLSQIGTASIVLVCVAALALGRLRERLTGGLFLLGAAATLWAQVLTRRYDPVWTFFAIDLVIWLVLLGLCWRADTLWPFAATAFQGMGVAAHLIRFVRPETPTWTYITVISLTSNAAVAALAFGVWRAVRLRRARRTGGRS